MKPAVLGWNWKYCCERRLAGSVGGARDSFFLRFYLFIHEREREAETQAEGEAGSMQGARRGTRSRDSRIRPWAKGRRQTTEPPRDPPNLLSFCALAQLICNPGYCVMYFLTNSSGI